MKKRHRKQSKGKGLWVSTSSSEGTNLSRSPGIHTPGNALSPHLWFYGALITQAQLIQPLAIGDWTQCRDEEVTLKFQDTNPVVGFPSNNQLPSFAVIQSHLINREKIPLF